MRLVAGTLRNDLGSYTQLDGETRLAGGRLSSSSSLYFQGGTLTGSGVIDASVINNAAVRPDYLHGPLIIEGDYTQSSSGSLTIDLAGTDPETGFGRLVVRESASLFGVFSAALVAGFSPADNQSFEILSYQSHVGAFGTMNLPALPTGLTFRTRETGIELKLVVVGTTNSFTTFGRSINNSLSVSSAFRAVLIEFKPLLTCASGRRS